MTELKLAMDDCSRPARRSEAGRGLKASLPLLIGVVPFGLVLGAQAARKGLTAVEMPLMAGLNFAGGSEFAAIGLWTSPPHVLLIAAVTFLVNSRHILMGAALAPYLRHLPKWKIFSALFLMCDESWALGLADSRYRAADGGCALSLPYYLGAAIGIYLAWVVFTTLGAIVGPVMGDIRGYGLDMAFPAVFLVLMRGMWPGARAARPWLVSLVVAGLTYLVVPGAWYVAAGILSGLAAAFFWAEDKT
jgi:4-azaleucine resistance transporter AzlC